MLRKTIPAIFGLVVISGMANAQGVFWTEVGGGKIDSSIFNGSSEATLLSSIFEPLWDRVRCRFSKDLLD